MRLLAPTLPVVLSLAACGQEPAPAPAPEPERDPIARQALFGEIATDPDLVGRNLANAALGGGTDHSIPAIVATREEIEAARREALSLAGDAALLDAPADIPRDPRPIPEAATVSLIERASLVEGLRPCAAQMDFTARWAARMPAAVPLFPRSNTLDAAGIAGGGGGQTCDLRAVAFATPVAPDAVAGFYRAMMAKAGLAPQVTMRDGDMVVQGAKGAGRAALFVRTDPHGITRGELIVSRLARR